MRARQVAGMLGAAMLVGGCAATIDENAAPAPAYGVVRQDRTSVELLVRDATVERSKSVIRTWLTANTSGERYLTVTVLRARDASTYICRAEFVADEETAQSTTSGRIPGPYPAIVFDCPTGGPAAGG